MVDTKIENKDLFNPVTFKQETAYYLHGHIYFTVTCTLNSPVDVRYPAASNKIVCSDDSIQMQCVLHSCNFGVAYCRVNYRMTLVIKT